MRGCAACIADIGVSASTNVVVTAAYDGTARTTSLWVVPPLLSNSTVTANVHSAPSNGDRYSTRKRSGARGRPDVGLANQLSRRYCAGLVTIPAGATSTTFPASSRPVATTVQVTITASQGAGTRTATLQIRPGGEGR